MDSNRRPESMERIVTKAQADAFIDEQVKLVREQVGDQKVLLALSGGVDSSVDAETMRNAGIKSIQIHTGGMCHLDADMTRQGLTEFGTKDLDLVVLENVGFGAELSVFVSYIYDFLAV